MKNQKSKNIRLGILVFIGTILLITALYTIGSNQNLFGSKIRVIADFKDVNGLMTGNNVHFSGINIGTVESVKIFSDSSIRVVMVIQKNAQKYIKKNAIASIGTDGLMGNKLVNINLVNQQADMIEEGDLLRTIEPVATDQMMHTLNRTNEDVALIVKNLKEISEKLNSENSLWSILADTVISENIREAIVEIKLTSQKTAIITGDLSNIVKGISEGKGTLGALLTESTLSNKLEQTIVNIEEISDSLAYITGDLKVVSSKIQKGEGAIGTLLMDTVFMHDLNKSMENIRMGSDGFNQNMEALKHSIFLRRYFRKKEK
ncbi:MlaD family protein [Marivirga salinae]|uniref:MlaD family protein n=1 Tax=Marivirga salinarum TaxID=3059078 RepID=A0AA49GCV5_9BACT|nr:MlaD family protein [Marivirga sp. BDSF4-3]WKK76984.2 MlaD family protein [Marivirga sp. BDSF4-3]